MLIIFFLLVTIIVILSCIPKNPVSRRRIGNLTPIYPALPMTKLDEEGNVIPSLVEIDMQKSDNFAKEKEVLNPFVEKKEREEREFMSYIEGSKPIQRLN